jgi:hypothetical protein
LQGNGALAGSAGQALKGNQVKIPDSPAAVSSYTFPIIFATVSSFRNGKAFGKGNKSEDLPLHDYSTLSGKRRRVKPELFYSSFIIPQALDQLDC